MMQATPLGVHRRADEPRVIDWAMLEFPPALPRAEYLSPAELAEVQRARFAQQIAYVAASSPFYQRAWGGRAVPGALEGLAELPLTDKEALRADQAALPPFGSYQAAPVERICRVHRTGGTTGRGMNLTLSRADAAMTAAIGARAQSASGLGPQHRVVHCLNYQLWMGGFSDHTTLEETGAAVVPFGVGSTERLIDTIRELGITAISCTPSYPAVLEQVIADKFPGLAPRDLGLELGLFGGEAGLDNPAFRARLEDTWGFKARNANYGVSDAFCNFAGQTEVDNDLHYFAADVMFPELIEPDDAAPLPWAEGTTGELVLTHLTKECQPLVRFRTGDIITLTGTGTAACGRTAPRLRVVGRTDDMIVVRGINVFPTPLTEIVNRLPELSGEYRIVLRGPGPYDALPLEVELAAEVADAEGLARGVAAMVKKELGVTAAVRLAPPRSLPRTDHKTQRVVRAAMEEPT